MTSVLTIAGSDPSGGAGIQADLRAFEAHGIAGLSVVTALTAQNTCGVEAVDVVDAGIVRRQLETLLDDIRPDAVKIGMLGSAAQVEAVADILERYAPANIVLDPVLASTGGFPFLDDAGVEALIRRLLPLATVVTPNLIEAQALTGATEAAAEKLIALGARAVLIKGGHREGRPVDVLTIASIIPVPSLLGARGLEFDGERIDTPHTHGTGCLLASSIAANLAQGVTLVEAVARAKRAVRTALENPIVIGQGRGYPSTGRSISGPRPSISGLYVLTDPDLRPDRSPVEMVAAALAGGARIIQLRDKIGSTPALIDLARRLCAMCHRAGALFFVNDRIDIALASGADGVHLGPDDMAPADARRLAGPGLLIGVSVSTVEEASPIAPYADYLGVGAIYGSSTKLDAGEPVGVGRIRQIKAAFPTLPVVAIGGIGPSNIADVIDAGANSVAVISAVLCADDMQTATRSLANAFVRSEIA